MNNRLRRPCPYGTTVKTTNGYCICSGCIEDRAEAKKSRRRKWQSENPEKCYAYNKRWNENNPEARRASVQAWRDRNPEIVAAINKRAGAKWHKNNPGSAAARVRKRQAAKMNRTPSWADNEKIKSFYVEAARLTKETGIPHEVDHIIPLQGELVSGLHVHENLQVIKRRENRSKKNKICDA